MKTFPAGRVGCRRGAQEAGDNNSNIVNVNSHLRCVVRERGVFVRRGGATGRMSALSRRATTPEGVF